MQELNSDALQTARFHQLTESLSSMRIAEKSDVVLICQNKEFFAHKLILETASPYFVTMFNAQLEEAKTGRVLFDDIEDETLKHILDYIYLGKVENLETEEQFKKVLAASHLMQLEKLCQFCCGSLGNMLNVENFFELLRISEQYESDDLRENIELFWLANVEELLKTESFTAVSDTEVIMLVNYLKSRKICLDSIVTSILQWLLHDLNDREKFAESLLTCVDGELLSKKCAESLLQDQKMMDSSHIVAIELSKIIMVALRCSYEKPFPNTTHQQWATIITYVSRRCNVEMFDPRTCYEEVPEIVERSCDRHCFQRFDLGSMSWLPLHYWHLNSGYQRTSERMCQYKDQIYLYSSHKENENGIFDLKKNMFQGNICFPVKIKKCCTICYFKGNFYTFGGASPLTVEKIKPGDTVWTTASSLQVSQKEFPAALTSSDYIYVIGESPESDEDLVIQYTSTPDRSCEWEVFRVRKQSLNASQFFILNNSLHFLYFGESDGKLLIYSHDCRRFTIKTTLHWPDTETKSLELSKFQNPQSPFVFFSKICDKFSIPCFLWEPARGKWTKLPSPRGKCFIPKTEINVEMVYSLDF